LYLSLSGLKYYNKDVEGQICQIDPFIFENVMDDIPEDVYELVCFPTAINNGMKNQLLYSDILK